jgi:phenylalanyl-tRNA synthetase alpha chain
MRDAFVNHVESLRARFRSERDSLSPDSFSECKTRYLGRSGLVSELMKKLGSVPREHRPECGKAVNDLKREIGASLDAFRAEGKDASRPGTPAPDYTLPGRTGRKPGTLHPLTLVSGQICALFERLGFSVVEGPEIETDYNNFTALNIPEDHPARDMHDTFYLEGGVLLRTHTSPVQIRVMKNGVPPFRIIAPGKVYRRDSDITHSPMFHQIEGLSVGRDVNFGHLKSVLTLFAKNIFSPDSKVRFRPSFFPFTEPSAEVDISCMMCGGAGCRVCSGSGWIEILGAGMVDPAVLKNVGIDPDEYSGYAFGMGVERIAMLKYAIHDIRLFFENHAEFLRQFAG